MMTQQDPAKQIQEIRSMMERSSKFISLSGWAGIVAGIYAIAAAWIAYRIYDFNPDELIYTSANLSKVIYLAIGLLLLALLTAVLFSRKKARSNGEPIWNATSRRLLSAMAVPLVTGGLVILAFISKGLTGLLAPASLLFYGLALYNGGFYTIPEVRTMGYAQIVLGLLGFWFIDFGLIFWTIGFGGIHIVYGVYMYFRYER
ncbi:MAG: hypothetical protein GVY20_00650 [Bacteroidetes bacterium]|nr:hypothetical protein [Bacteroidota bacterium]